MELTQIEINTLEAIADDIGGRGFDTSAATIREIANNHKKGGKPVLDSEVKVVKLMQLEGGWVYLIKEYIESMERAWTDTTKITLITGRELLVEDMVDHIVKQLYGGE